MLNTLLLNTRLLNDTSAIADATSTATITFNGYALNLGGPVITKLTHENFPARDRDTFRIPRNHGGNSVSDFWGFRKITMEGYLIKDTLNEMEEAIDEMKQELSTENGTLDLVVAGVSRRYTATLVNGNSMFQREHYHVTFIPFKLVFECLDPFGKSLDYISQSFTDKTSLSFAEEAENAGNTDAQAVLILTFSAASGVTKVNFNNTTKGEQIEITQAISASDVLEMDSENYMVKLNGSEIDYDGEFPKFSPGTNQFTLTITGTSATYTLTVKHKKTYL